jgi:hypothetical protein
MPIKIKKRVSLEFLGEDYKEAYLVFQSIPVGDLESIQSTLKELESEGKSSVAGILDVLKKYFISGQFPDDDGKPQDVTKNDLGDLDPESCIACFKAFTGQELDPKAEMPLTSTSPTAETQASTS